MFPLPVESRDADALPFAAIHELVLARDADQCIHVFNGLHNVRSKLIFFSVSYPFALLHFLYVDVVHFANKMNNI